MAALTAMQRPSYGLLARPPAHAFSRLECKPRVLSAFASQEPDAGTSQMSLAEAESILGVSPGTDFEAIMRSKDSKLRKVGGDQDKRFEVCVCLVSGERFIFVGLLLALCTEYVCCDTYRLCYLL
jgi:hypothetical protein